MPCRVSLEPGLEVLAHARTQRFRLADVEHVAPPRRGRGTRPASPGGASAGSRCGRIGHRRPAYSGAPRARVRAMRCCARRARRRCARLRRRRRPAQPKLVVGAVEDAAKWRATRRGADGARAALGLPRDRAQRGLDADGARRAAPTCRRCAARSTRPTAAAASGRCSPSTQFSAVDAADAGAPRRSSPRTRRRSCAGAAGGARRDRRQRAEPEPLLAAAVRRRTARDAAAVDYEALLAADLRRAEGASTRDLDVIGGGLAPRGGDNADGTRPDALADAVHPRPRRAPTGRAAATQPIMDAFSIHVYGESSARPADVRAPELDVDRDRRLRQARRPAREAFAGPRSPARAADRLRRVRRRDARSRAPRRTLYTGREVADAAVDEETQARSTPTRSALAALPAATCGCCSLPRRRRDAPRRAPERRSATPTAAPKREPRGAGPRTRSTRAGQARGGDADNRARSRRRESFDGWAVRRLHVLPRRPGVAPAAGRGARGGEGRLRRGGRGVRAALRPRCAPTRRPASGRTRDFFLWKITERYEDLGELGAALNATPLAGWLETPYSYLATTKASQYTSARRARKIIAAGIAVPRRLPVREGAAVVRAARGGPAAGDGRAHPHRPRGVPDDPQPHDVLVRDRRPGVHDRVRVRRAGRLHAPDADGCATPRRRATPSATRRSSSGST